MSAAEILPVAPQKDRVLLRFEPTGENGAAAKEARVPAGTVRSSPNEACRTYQMSKAALVWRSTN